MTDRRLCALAMCFQVAASSCGSAVEPVENVNEGTSSLVSSDGAHYVFTSGPTIDAGPSISTDFCYMSGLGNRAGNAFQANVAINGNTTWVGMIVGNQSLTPAGEFDYRCVHWSSFANSGGHFSPAMFQGSQALWWTDSICYILGWEGNSGTSNITIDVSAVVDPNPITGRRWTLTSSSNITPMAACAYLGRKVTYGPSGSWQTSQMSPTILMPVTDGICTLTHIEGNFTDSHNGRFVTIEPFQGNWILYGAGEGGASMSITAQCIKYAQ